MPTSFPLLHDTGLKAHLFRTAGTDTEMVLGNQLELAVSVLILPFAQCLGQGRNVKEVLCAIDDDESIIDTRRLEAERLTLIHCAVSAVHCSAEVK